MAGMGGLRGRGVLHGRRGWWQDFVLAEVLTLQEESCGVLDTS